MNFFKEQARARQRTGLLVFLFVLAVLAIVAGVNAVVLAVLQYSEPPHAAARSISSWSRHGGLLVFSSAATLLLILGASFFRSLSLNQGGGAVAESLGGTLIDAQVKDVARKRLVNVAEEMAIAAGVPVPQVYVLENETGINAFAAGLTPSNAAVAVTRGTLEQLNREELQGVMAHEFGHILNGDMRLNTRLIGVVFGILTIALLGRLLIRAAQHTRGGLGAGLLGIGVALLVLGYAGVFFGNLIKAAVSRSREFLADASAVQFTRNPQGIGGALKKIAVATREPTLVAPRLDEVSHMLLSNPPGAFSRFFSTHPPILERIRAIEPYFRESELARIQLKPVSSMGSRRGPRDTDVAVAVSPMGTRRGPRATEGAFADSPWAAEPGGEASAAATAAAASAWASEIVSATVGNPTVSSLALAQDWLKAIPPALSEAAHSTDEVVSLVVGLMLARRANTQGLKDEKPNVALPGVTHERVTHYRNAIAKLAPEQHLTLLEISLPTLRRRDASELRALVARLDAVLPTLTQMTVFDFSVARLLRQHLVDVLAPKKTAPLVYTKLFSVKDELQTLFAVLAKEGHADERNRRMAYAAGLKRLLPAENPAYTVPALWVPALNRALTRIDKLSMNNKKELIEAMVTTVGYDTKIVLAEFELLRMICASLHCPVPALEMNG